MHEKEREDIINSPSPFSTNAKFVASFIAEVGRNLETALAVERGTTKPTGNWIHTFKNFRDVADVLHPLTFGGLTADEAAYRQALQYELIGILKRLLLKHKGDALDPRHAIITHWRAHGLRSSPKQGDFVDLSGQEWDRFSTLMLALLGVSPFELVVVADALTSSLFLEFDNVSGGYVQTDAYQGLAKLIDEIRLINVRLNAESLTSIFEYSPRNRGGRDVPVEIEAQKLALLHGIGLRWVNIISLTRALIVHLHGQPFTMPDLMPFSPVHGFEDQLDTELPSESDTRRWLGIS
ncbi:hypothetical protein ACT009_08500 [Sphingomonas sp. Tas61C01]|uniref:hypothetical protein n=1 Tax=Sphingomonas sp. Tas61C01 TaxID=3458297 RepID=UPI00403E6754